ncbi:MAG TPA: nickel pincer cofactor biosynthesis protein LarC [Pyrinomonadaceae bacterium]|nr:nickel pincer cofactor biosynthesis protein LarC [Pyrinomonadaceae bacterium]
MKTLYFDCFAGASGNMILGALVALGVDEKELIEQIKLLNITDFEIEFTIKDKSGISAIHANVKVPHEHAHRHLSTIEKIINDSLLKDSIKTRAVAIFRKLSEAEAKIHGIDVQKVHFHEVGAMDAIIDVVGACIGFEMLEIEKFVCSRIHVGSGFAKMAHGKFPVPPPAVAELLQNAPIYSTEIVGELITPTGAAIIATVCDEFGNLPEITVEKTAYGAGTRDYKDFPNALRLILGEVQNSKFKIQNSKLLQIETNLDDVSPEILGFVMEKAFELGAMDCWFTPIQMKKNRPATLVSILCNPSEKEKFINLLITETPTLGVRVREIERICLEREFSKVETKFGEIAVKIARFGEKIVNIKPEFDVLKEIARRENLPLREVEAEVRKAIVDFGF